MITFGRKLAECRKKKSLTQKELAKLVQISEVTIGKYEREEMIPAGIELARKLAANLDVTLPYLLSQDMQYDVFKEKKMLKRFLDIMNLPDKERNNFLSTLDNLIKAAKINSI